jgi:hypothetical protein
METNNNQQIIQQMKTALQTERDAYHLTAQTIMETQKDLKAVHQERKRKIVEEFEAQIVHDPEKHAKRDAYSLQRHFKHELEKFLENRTYGLTLEGAEVSFVDYNGCIVFTIGIHKKKTN